MKRFVFNSEKMAGGRHRRPRDLVGPMVIVAGLIYMGQFLSLFQLPVLLEYLFAGIILGGTAGRVAVVLCERREGELPPEQVRDMEIAGTATGVGLMALLALVQIVFNILNAL
jgi:hypothetical protein